MSALGYKVRRDAGGYVHDVRDLAGVAAFVAELYPERARVKACVSLTSERELTTDELRALVDLAAALIVMPRHSS